MIYQVIKITGACPLRNRNGISSRNQFAAAEVIFIRILFAAQIAVEFNRSVKYVIVITHAVNHSMMQIAGCITVIRQPEIQTDRDDPEFAVFRIFVIY